MKPPNSASTEVKGDFERVLVKESGRWDLLDSLSAPYSTSLSFSCVSTGPCADITLTLCIVALYHSRIASFIKEEFLELSRYQTRQNFTCWYRNWCLCYWSLYWNYSLDYLIRGHSECISCFHGSSYETTVVGWPTPRSSSASKWWTWE